MYYIVTNDGDYRDLPHAKTRREAEIAMHLIYSDDEIEELEAEIFCTTEE